MSADLSAESPPELKGLPVGGRDFYLFHTADGPHLLLVDGSQIFKIGEELAQQLAASSAEGADAAGPLLAAHGLGLKRFIGDEPPLDPPVRALSLAVAERCNLGCTYCYAEGGGFGGPARDMPWEVAEASVRRLFADAKPGERVNLAFLGGEPLTNRALIRRATELAARIAGERGIPIGFSITTNGTLLTPDDAAFFERYGFAVTISLDGVGAIHDRLRPTKGGRGSYDRVIANVRPLLARQRHMQVSARVTVTPANLGLRATLDHFIDLGFHSVGFSPMLSAPSGRGEMQAPDLGVLLDQMIDCGREFERRIATGEPYPFANMTTALDGDPPRHAPPLSVRRRGELFRGVGVGRTVRLSSLRRGRRRPPWAMSGMASIERGSGSGWPSAWSTGRNPVAVAGPAICAAAGATTR